MFNPDFNPIFPRDFLNTVARYTSNPDKTSDSSNRDLETIKEWLVSESGDANAIVSNASGSGLLHFILMGKSRSPCDATELIQLLVAHGADVRRAQSSRWTPLHWCTHVGEAVALLNAGADIDAKSFTDYSNGHVTPLQKAMQRDMFDVARLLIRRGADLELVTSETGYHKEWVEDHTWCARREIWQLIDDVKAAGGWKSYVRAPRVELVRLRLLCARGRARPPSSNPILARLFGAPGSSKKSTRASKLASRPLPKEVFWHVLSYWRTIRDDYY
jgi:hypothetical protein